MKKQKFLRAFLIFLVFAFFAGIAVIAIIISRGGLITNEGVVFNSGIIRIITDPQNLVYDTYLNGEKISHPDNQIKSLVSGTYKLRIEVLGYATWEKDLKVNTGIVTDVYAKLYPVKLATTQITKTNVDKAFFSGNGEYVYYVVKDSEFGNEKGIWRLKLNPSEIFLGNNQSQPSKISNILNEFSDAIIKGFYNILISPDNSKIIFFDVANNNHYVLDVNGGNELPVSLESQLGFNIENVSWFNASNSLIIQNGPLLFEYNLTNNLKVLIKYSPEAPAVYSVNNNQVVYFDEKTPGIMIYKNQAATPLTVVNITLPEKITSLHLAEVADRFLILGTPSGYKYLDVEKSLLKDITGLGVLFEFADDGRSALFIDDNFVLTAYTVTELVALNSVDVKVNPVGITLAPQENSDDKVFFTPTSTHFLYYQQSSSTIFVLDRDGSNKISLLVSSGILPYFNFDAQSTSMFVLLQDEIISPTVPVDGTAAGSQSRANIYKIDLLKPQK